MFYKIIKQIRGNGSIHKQRLSPEVVVCAEHDLPIGLDLDVNDASISMEWDFGSYGRFDFGDTSGNERQDDEVECRSGGHPLQHFSLPMRSPFQPEQFSGREISLECDSALFRCKRAHHGE